MGVAEVATLRGPGLGPSGMEIARRAWGSGGPRDTGLAARLSRRHPAAVAGHGG